MIRQIIKIGSILLVASASFYAMERPTLKELATNMIAELIVSNSNPSYCVKALNILPSALITPVVQQLMVLSKDKSALPILLLSYKLCQQQQQSTVRQSKIYLTCSDDKQLQLTSEQSRELMQVSAAIRNLIQDIEGVQDNYEQVEEIPLPLLTQDQITVVLSHLPIINALNTNTSILPMLHQEISETAALSSYYFKYTALQQLKEHLTNQTIPILCDLIIAVNYLDIQNNNQTTNFIELATQALGNKLLQLPQYQDEYDAINALPHAMQRKLVHYLIDNSAVRHALCSNSTDAISNTAQTLTSHTGTINSVSWSPDGKQLASSAGDKTIKIWNATTATCTRTLTGYKSNAEAISWLHNSNKIVSSFEDGILKVWDASTCIDVLEKHTGCMQSIALSPDDSKLATCSYIGIIKIWDAITGDYICTMPDTGHTYFARLVVWSPDGNMIASGSDNIRPDDTIRIWDITTRTCIRILQGHTDWVRSISW